MRCRSSESLICLATIVVVVLGVGALATAEQPDPAALPDEIPPEAKKVKNPREATPQSIANGKQIFASQCAMCHGATGDGKGALAARFEYEIPDFTDPRVQSSRTDGALFYLITHGHGKMTGEEGRLSADTRWDLVNYVRSLGKN